MSALLLSSLGVVCPTCDQYNAPQSGKCSDCGTPLQGGAPAKPVSAPAPAPRAAAVAPAPVPLTPTPKPAPKPLSVAPVAPVPPARTPPTGDTNAPPGMRPAARQAPVPASELLKKPPAPAAAHAPAPAPAPTPPAAAKPQPSKFGLTVVSGQNQGQRFRLGGAGCMVGRARGAILFPDDPFVAPHHATFILRDARLFIRDEASASGIYVSVSGGQESIVAGGFFAAGNRCFRYAGPLARAAATSPGQPQVYGAPVPPGQALYALEEIIVGGRAGRAVVTQGPLLTIGQAHCDLSYPGDGTLANRHCELSPTPTGALLRDLSGGLGTFVRLYPGAERALNPGDKVRIGQQVLQVDLLS